MQVKDILCHIGIVFGWHGHTYSWPKIAHPPPPIVCKLFKVCRQRCWSGRWWKSPSEWWCPQRARQNKVKWLTGNVVQSDRQQRQVVEHVSMLCYGQLCIVVHFYTVERCSTWNVNAHRMYKVIDSRDNCCRTRVSFSKLCQCCCGQFQCYVLWFAFTLCRGARLEMWMHTECNCRKGMFWVVARWVQCMCQCVTHGREDCPALCTHPDTTPCIKQCTLLPNWTHSGHLDTVNCCGVWRPIYTWDITCQCPTNIFRAVYNP